MEAADGGAHARAAFKLPPAACFRAPAGEVDVGEDTAGTREEALAKVEFQNRGVWASYKLQAQGVANRPHTGSSGHR